MKIRVCDFETSDLPPEGAIIQVGQCDVMMDDDGRGPPAICLPSSMFVNPGKPITPAARGAHHIRDKDIESAPAVDVGLSHLMSGNGTPDVFCAHNAVFERQLFSGGNIPWICTRKIAMRLWPGSPNHQNQTLRYFLGVDDDDGFESWLAMPPHRAAPDCYVTAHILRRAILTGTSVDQLIEWSNQPSLLPGPINFGKHKGTPWPQVDAGYLEWLIRQPDMDTDTAFTAKYWLDRRRSDSR